ncbi:MAG TPA: hypothetical protein VKE74_21815 [Gemmataceae bacterium]|nr:hypothetical protein [Gemmataceae bacterium]
MRRWMAAPLVFAAALGLTDYSDTLSRAHAQAKGAAPVEETIRTADGMKLKGLFHATTTPKAGQSAATAPVVILLYSPGVDKSMTKGDWDGLINMLNAEGFHVFRFDWRGHGKSTDIDTPTGMDIYSGFWTNNFSGPSNMKHIKGAGKKPIKNDLFVKEIQPAYFPTYVQDLAAVRCQLDQRNDQGSLNTSSIYVIATEESATLALFWLTAEWNRPAVHPILPGGLMYQVCPDNRIVVNLEAGRDIAGVVSLSGVRSQTIPQQTIQSWTKNTLKMRDLNPMLFLHGEKDTASKSAAHMYYKEVLVAEGNPGLGVKKLEQTFVREVKGTALKGVGLLGKNGELKTEDTIIAYLKQLEKERGNLTVKKRGYVSPYYIDMRFFQVNP